MLGENSIFTEERLVGGAKEFTVLVIEGPAEQTLADRLREKYTVIKAGDGEAALRILEEKYREIAAILLDMQLPEGGSTVLTRLRASEHSGGIPIIVVSAEPDADEESELLELGANDYIRRNARQNVLLNRVKNLIQMKETAVVLDQLEKDDLTGIYNRQGFLQRAELRLKNDPTHDYDLIVTDIDKFKLVNTIYGEERANILLQEMAVYLFKNRGEGLCGRYGADRFIILRRTAEDTDVWISGLTEAFAAAASIPGLTIRSGIYSRVDRKLSMVLMCDKAILALKSIKTRQGKKVASYDGPVSQRHYREQLYEARFPDALRNKEFVVWYQPKYDPYNNQVVGAEALVRWTKPEGGFYQPGEFVSLLEANGTIGQLDEYVFRVVCTQLGEWKKKGKPLVPISVNLSRNSMHRPDLAEVYSAIAAENGVDPKYLPIEITETTATDSVEIQKNAERIRQKGFPLHMDDFGSEHSSLQTLNVLDFDVVKLDKGLIDFIGDKEGDLVLKYTMALGGELGLRIVAEGVETRNQLEFLKENGCDQVQGFYYSRPLPLEEFEKKLSNERSIPDGWISGAKEGLYVLSLASHMEKMMTQRMLPRIPGGFLVYENDEEERIVYSNKYLWNLFGCEDEVEFLNLVHGSFRGVVSPEELDSVEDTIHSQIAVSENGMDHVEFHIVCKDGTRIPVVDYGHLEYTKKGSLYYVFIYRK